MHTHNLHDFLHSDNCYNLFDITSKKNKKFLINKATAIILLMKMKNIKQIKK